MAEGTDKRIKLLSRDESEEDRVINISLRPSTLSEFVGQKELIENLSVSVKAAMTRNEPLDHVLFSGPPGLGKTTLAHIISHQINAKIVATSGPAIARPGDLIGVLTNLNKGDVLFIDEIHRLSKVVEEFLYPAMENFQIDFIIDKGPYAKTIKFNLKHFTLIGATTRSGLLTAPLRGRFGIFHHLDFYSPENLSKIVTRSAKLLDVTIDAESADEIARRSRGTPRIANRLLHRVRDYAQVKSDGKITKEITNKALAMQGIDEMGLDNIDRKVLKVLMENYNGGPAGIESIAASLNEESDTIVDVVEPFLLKAGFLKRTSRGRQVTEAAYRHLKVTAAPSKELF